MHLEITDAKSEHVEELVANLREGDRREVERYCGGTEAGKAHIRALVSDGDVARVGLIDGEVAAIWGARAGSALGRFGSVWCLTTGVVDRHRKTFVRESRREYEALLDRFGSVEVVTDVEYGKAIRWMRWLGFRFAGSCMQNDHTWLFARATKREVA